MKIRSITTFLNPGWPVDEKLLAQAGKFNQAAPTAFTQAGYEVQTTRLATVPFPLLLGECALPEVLAFAHTLESAAQAQGYSYVAIGPALPEVPASYRVIPDVLAATQNLFASAVMASPQGGVVLPAVRACAEIITALKDQDPNGFGNLYFAALANVAPGAPFFPAAYHDGGPPAFAIAAEAASLAVEAFSAASSLAEARQNLVSSMETHARRLVEAAQVLAQAYGMRFAGLDLTLAPFPAEQQSIGTALEKLGLPAIGLNGSLAAAAFLADTMDRAQYPRTGFNGLMLPVLEDAVLARRAAGGELAVNDLLMYSAVCGTGLDTIPLPGDTPVEQIYALLLDLAALAQRLEKPLTARLMPIPGKSAGEPTGFDFAFFANSKVMPLRAAPLNGLLAGTERFSLKRRN